MLRAASGAGIVLCPLHEPAYLIFLGLHIPSSSSFQSSGVLGHQTALLYLRSFFDRDLLSAFLPSPPSHTPLPFTPPRDQIEMGKKRASPGADTEKSLLGDVELSDAQFEKLDKIAEESNRVDIALGMRHPPPKCIALPLMWDWLPTEFLTQEKSAPFLEKRREALKGIPKFWPVALLNHPSVALHAVHQQDQVALGYLEDVWLTRDPKEKRCFTLEFVRCFGSLRKSHCEAYTSHCSTSRRTHSSLTQC